MPPIGSFARETGYPDWIRETPRHKSRAELGECWQHERTRFLTGLPSFSGPNEAHPIAEAQTGAVRHSLIWHSLYALHAYNRDMR